MNFDEVKMRLDAHAKAQGRYQDRQRLLIQYGLECFLRRLAASAHANTFVLKGSLLYALHAPEDPRNTKDADFQLQAANSPENVRRLFTEVCLVAQDDGVTFDAGGVRLEEAGMDRGYTGYKVTVPIRYGDDPSTLQFDVGFGEAIAPDPEWHAYPSIARLPAVRIHAYPLETFLSEKFETNGQCDMGKTRLKDYYDLGFFAARAGLEGERLCRAVWATFERRPLPADVPVGITDRFFSDKRRKTDWSAFLRRHALPKAVRLEDCCQRTAGPMMPVVPGLTNGTPISGRWDGNAWASSLDGDPFDD